MKMANTRRLLLAVIALSMFITTAAVQAANITVYDGDGYLGTGMGGENNETEPGCILSQAWDLEAILYDAGHLTLIGGWDFMDGAPGYSFASGDLFLSTNGAPLRAGPGGTGNWDYERVFDIAWPAPGGNSPASTTVAYTLRDISGGAVLSQVTESINRPESNPYRWVSGGHSLYGGTALFQTYASDALVNAAFAADLSGSDALTGGRHYSVTFDYVPQTGDDPWFHFTEQCGNDNLMGHLELPGRHDEVPEPASIVLLGLGLAGILVRKRFLI